MTYVKMTIQGVVIWLIPLLMSFFFYTPEQELVTSYALFKSVMVVVLTLTVVAVNYFRPIKTMNPLIVAAVYTVISLLLDFIVVIPMTGLSIGAYIEQIALIYIVIFALTWAMLRSASVKST